MKNRTCIYSITIIALFLFIASGCKKEDSPINQTNGRTSAVFNPNLTYGTMTDQEGNEYKTFYINGQTWMAENLRTRKYRNGDNIPKIVNNTTWVNLTTGAYCNYNNTENIDTIATYGRLYNWYTISDSRNLAPKGWHVATNTDWELLALLLGGENVAGFKFRENGDYHWYGFGEYATNESGLTILPSGVRSPSDGTFCCIGAEGIYWSSTQADDSYAWIIPFVMTSSECVRISNHMGHGFAIRCVKD